jgi:hypothetical protein
MVVVELLHAVAAGERGRRGVVAAGRGEPRIARGDEVVDAFEQFDEPHGARIDDAGLAQHRQLARRVRQCRAGALQRMPEPALQVAPMPRTGLGQAIGEGADHAQDGAFARIGERFARTRCAAGHGRGQLLVRERARLPDHLARAMQELREDRAGVAARAVDGVVGHLAQQDPGRGRTPAQAARQHAAQREGEVAARVAIGHRKHVDLVENVPPRQDAPRARRECTAQGRSGNARHIGARRGKGDGDHGPSVCTTAAGPSCCAAMRLGGARRTDAAGRSGVLQRARGTVTLIACRRNSVRHFASGTGPPQLLPGNAMKRLALTALLLSLSTFAAAQVVTPNHASGDGANTSCPDEVRAEANASAEGRPDDVALPPAAVAPAVPAKAVPAKATPSIRPKTGMRWHSFLPGMMK